MRCLSLIVAFSTVLLPAQAYSAAGEVLLSSPFITGSKLYSARDFTAAIGPHIGQPVSRELIDQIGAEIQALYRRDGYVMPEIVAADSELASSTPRLHIFEAQIAEVAIRGNSGPHLEAIMSEAGDLERSSIHKQRSLRFLRRIEELPGLGLRASFEPRANEPNRYTLVLNLSYEAVRANVTVHNRGTDDLGRTMLGGRIAFNGLLGAQETVTLIGAASTTLNRYSYVGGRIERHFGKFGTKLDISRSQAVPESDWHYSSERARLQVDMAGLDNGIWRVDPLAAIAARSSSGDDSLGVNLTQTDTRSVELGAAARRASRGATTYLWSVFERGFDGFGATGTTLYGVPPEVQFSKAMFEISHLQTLSSTWKVKVDVDAQWSEHHLPAGERFTFGGSRFGRAFDPAALIGDSGTALSVQLERHQQWKHAWFRQGKVYLQTDYGYAQDNGHGHDDAASVTAGLSAKIASMLTSLELSHPLMRPDEEAHSSDLHAFVLMRIDF